MANLSVSTPSLAPPALPDPAKFLGNSDFIILTILWGFALGSFFFNMTALLDVGKFGEFRWINISLVLVFGVFISAAFFNKVLIGIVTLPFCIALVVDTLITGRRKLKKIQENGSLWLNFHLEESEWKKYEHKFMMTLFLQFAANSSVCTFMLFKVIDHFTEGKPFM